MRYLRQVALSVSLILITSLPAKAEGFISPFIGYNFGGDSNDCAELLDCSHAHANFGVDLGATGSVVGFEEDISYAKNFFGDAPGTDNSVLSAMSNLLIGVGVGPVRPYVVGGIGLIRPHVSQIGFSEDNNLLGFDIGGGIAGYFSNHVGLRGDIRHFHTFRDIDVLIFTGQRLDFWRASLGLALKF